MEGFIEAIYRNEIITFNLKGHGLTNEFIKDIKVKYVIEKGKGKLKKMVPGVILEEQSIYMYT